MAGGRRCTVCDHPEREAINRTILEGQTSIRDIAGRHSLSHAAVGRHSKNCVTLIPAAVARHERIQTMLAEQTEHAVAAHQGHTDAFLERIGYLNTKLEELLDECESDTKTRNGRPLRATVLRELRETLKLQATVTFQILNLKDADETSGKGEFIALVRSILKPYPDALEALDTGLSTPRRMAM